MDQYLEELARTMGECVGQEMQVGDARMLLTKFKIDTNYDPPIIKMEFRAREQPSAVESTLETIQRLQKYEPFQLP